MDIYIYKYNNNNNNNNMIQFVMILLIIPCKHNIPPGITPFLTNNPSLYINR